MTSTDCEGGKDSSQRNCKSAEPLLGHIEHEAPQTFPPKQQQSWI